MQLLSLLLAEIFAGQQPCAGRAGFLFVVSLHFAVGLPLFAQEPTLCGVEVVPQTPLAQRFVERLHEFVMLEAVVSQQQAHVGVVLLFDVGVVVLPVRARAAEFDLGLLGFEVGDEVRV